MPELPEVETMRRGILPVVGSEIVDVRRAPCKRRPIAIEPRIDRLRRRAAGNTLSAVERLGKRVVLELSSGSSLVLEPRMTGLVLLADPPTTEHLRLEIELDNRQHPRVLFWDRRGLGTVRLYSPAEMESLRTSKLGPDALAITADQLRERLSKSSRAVKVALLDQTVVAGIGNLYAAELLHVAGIDPRTRCDRLSRPQWQRIASAIGSVLNEAIKYEGSTLSDGTYRNALNKAGGYQNHHQVYDREGLDCPRCGAAIQRIVQAQRSTFFCRQCQKKR